MPFPAPTDPFYCIGSGTKNYKESIDSVSRCLDCGRLVTRMVNGSLYPHLRKCKRTEKWDSLHESLTARTAVRIVTSNGGVE
jgi:hypothetical protein